MRTVFSVLATCCLTLIATEVASQPPGRPPNRYIELEQLIKRIEAAETTLDQNVYARYLAETLRWQTSNGDVLSKRQRLERFSKEAKLSLYKVDRISLERDGAEVSAEAEYADGRRERHFRKFTENTAGAWQLTEHVARLIE